MSLLVSDLSANCVVRTYPIAKALERRYEVELLGPTFGDGVFAPYRDEFDYKTVPGVKYPGYRAVENRLLELITGDVVYAFKPLPTSFGLARRWQRRTGGPVVLDVEDWEVGGWRSVEDANPLLWWPYVLKHSAQRLTHPNGTYFHLLWEEHVARYADHVFVVSERLREVFGANPLISKLPHGADTSVFDPALFDRAKARAELGLGDDEHAILFTGTPRRHKGIRDLVDAMRKRPDAPLRLVIVGGRDDDPDLAEIRAADPRVTSLGYQPHARMPEFLAAADSVVLPQARTPFTEAQVPGKVYEAIAMGKPVIASRVSDLPEILDGCGLLVEPGDVDAVGDALDRLVGDPALARKLGEHARQRAIDHYSWDAMERILAQVFDRWA